MSPAMSAHIKLFAEEDLDRVLRERRAKIQQEVDQIPKDQLKISSDKDVLRFVSHKVEIAPIELNESAKYLDQDEIQVDVSGDTDRMWGIEGRKGKCLVPGTRYKVCFPFVGDSWIFRYKTTFMSLVGDLSEAGDKGGTVKLLVDVADDRGEDWAERAISENLKMFCDSVASANNQVRSYNSAVQAEVTWALQRRRERHGRHQNLAQKLNIPISKKPDAPELSPVKIELHRPPTLPEPSDASGAAEPGIEDADFEQILHFIRHQGRTYESSPQTFAKHDEEGLRNIMLAQLNGHFRGGATGETFRRRGKTDIRIEQEDRAAFVGECKIWKGNAVNTKALNQLLSYLTWRDSKAALIVFNTKTKKFSTILTALPESVRAHRCFIEELECSEEGEWRVRMHSDNDEDKHITVHIFAFDIFPPEEEHGS